MANPKRKLSMPAPTLGIEEREPLISQGQLRDCVNLLPIDGELRTRGGQRYVGSAAPVIGIEFTRGAAPSTTLAAIAGDTVWYMAAWLNNANSPLEAEEGAWKTLRFDLTRYIGPADALANTTLSLAYFSRSLNAWQGVSHRVYQTGSGEPAARVAFPFQENASETWILNTSADAPYGSDLFFDDWAETTVFGASRFWIRVTASSPVSANFNLSGATNMPVRPMAMQHFADRSGRSQLVVHTGYPVGRGSADDATAAPAYAEDDRYIELFHQPYVFDRGFLPVSLNAATLRDSAHLMFKSTGWQSRVRLSNASIAKNRDAGRVPLPSEQAAYIDVTQRMLLTTHSGPASMLPDVGGLRQLTGTTTLDAGRFTVEQYPYQVNLEAANNTIPQMRHLGRPTSVAVFDGRPFFGYGDGGLRWTFPAPREDEVSDLGFTYLADDDGHRIVALVPFGPYLLGMLENSLWLVEPSDVIALVDLQNYFARKVAGGIGLAGVNAYAIAEGLLYFLASDGIYVFDGQRATRISGSLKRTFDTGVSRTAMRNACAAFDKRRRQVWFSLARSGSYWNDLVLVYDLVTKGWFKLAGIEAEQMVYDDNAEVLYTCNSRGDVFQQDTGSGDGFYNEEGIAWRLETGPLVYEFKQVQNGQLHLFMRHYVGASYQSALVVDGAERDVETFSPSRSTTTYPRSDADERAWASQAAATYSTAVQEDHYRRKFAVPASWNAEELALRLRSSSPQPGQRISLLSLELQLEEAGDSRGA